MKTIFILLASVGFLVALRAQSVTPGQLAGTYEYRVNAELSPYTSTLTIKRNGHYERQTGHSAGTHKTTGTWEIKGETLWLTPDKKYGQNPYSLLIGNGYLKIGDVGVHEKLK